MFALRRVLKLGFIFYSKGHWQKNTTGITDKLASHPVKESNSPGSFSLGKLKIVTSMEGHSFGN